MTETKHYDFGNIDWDEFWQVLKGYGLCNKLRISAKKTPGTMENGFVTEHGLRRKTLK